MIETRELTPELWPALEKLFGKNGACAGCWCMWWRLDEGERISEKEGFRVLTRAPRGKQRARKRI